MKVSPCVQCALLSRNKNNPVCRDCIKRIQYVMALERTLAFTDVNPIVEKPLLLSPIQRIRRQHR